MRTWIGLVVFSSAASAAPPPETVCWAGDTEACLAVAESAFAAKQRDAALVTAQGLCEKGEGEGCIRLAHYMDKVNVSMRAGKTPAQLRERGIELLEASCTANSGPACFRLGKTLYQGKNIAIDPRRGQELLDKGCTLGHAAACVFLASLDRDSAKGRAYLDAMMLAMLSWLAGLGERFASMWRRLRNTFSPSRGRERVAKVPPAIVRNTEALSSAGLVRRSYTLRVNRVFVARYRNHARHSR